VFDDLESALTVEMTPLQKCVVRAVDEDERPLAGVKVASWPNVRWWNGGSQIYCHYLVRGEELLRKRDFNAALGEGQPQPFVTETNAEGVATLELPVSRQSLAVQSEEYELPVVGDRRDVSVTLTEEEPVEVTLKLQPRGTDRLGE
jgi:hypothetical protein